jgi:D-beta-D-heptose 7-phosphate kinase/D-beta-D-heptose 1-phosphate adenosyltransferase
MPEPADRIARFAGCRVLVIGDLMLDEFLWGKVSRISPEAPVPVVNVTGETYYPGGAANVARNLRELGAQPSVLGLAGNDSHGDRLCDLLESAGIRTTGVLRDPARPTTVKTRIIARNQQVVRVDRERITPIDPAQRERMMTFVCEAMGHADGIVVADYGKGALDQLLADHVASIARDRRKVLAVDPHPHTPLLWKGATAIKPNRIETFHAAGMRLTSPVDPALDDEPLLRAARALQQSWRPESLLVTLGEQGMLLFEGDAAPYHIPTRAKEVFDVSGAGDTAIAVLTLALIAGASPRESADLANVAAGIVVGKLGTATVAPTELAAAL